MFPIRLLICWFLATLGATAQGTEFAQLVREARAFEHGEGVAKDPARAIALFCEAARGGDVEAQYSLGWIHANGRGTNRDDGLAAYFFALAAQQGHPQSERMLRHVGTPQADVPACMRPPPEPEKVVVAQESDSIEDLVAATPQSRRAVMEMLVKLAPEYGIHPRLAMAVARTESNLNPAAVSPKNAQGLMQLIPETSARFNVTKPFDPEQNIRGGLSYLRWLMAYFRGQVSLVAAAYNAGEGAVNRYRGIPPYSETQGYVKRILGIYKKDSHPFDARITEPSPEIGRIRSSSLM